MAQETDIKIELEVVSCQGCLFVQDGHYGPMCGLQSHLLFYTGSGEAEGREYNIPHDMYQAKTFAAPDWCPLRKGALKVSMGPDGLQMVTTPFGPEDYDEQ